MSTFDLVDDADFVRESLLTFLRARQVALEMRSEQRASATVLDRLAMAEVLERIDSWIYDARAWLARRRLPCPCFGVQGRAPAAKAHGCAAVAVGAGAPSMPSPDADITSPADPLLLCLAGKEFPDQRDNGNNQTATAGEKLS